MFVLLAGGVEFGVVSVGKSLMAFDFFLLGGVLCWCYERFVLCGL